MPVGGARVGAGRKPKPCATAGCLRRRVPKKPYCLECARRPSNVLQHPSAPAQGLQIPTTNGAPEVEEFEAPDSLSMDERAVWMKQAPFAFKNGTLTRASSLSFERYCRVVVLEQNEAKSSAMGGANHRGLLKQINAYELQFLLTPAGKPMPQPAKAETPVEQPRTGLARFRG